MVIERLEDIVIVDNFLPENLFDSVSEMFFNEDYMSKKLFNNQYSSDESSCFNSIWGSNIYLNPLNISTSNIESTDFIRDFESILIETVKNIVLPKFKIIELERVNYSAFLYSQGNSLGWHDDLGYKFTFAFYIHKVWDLTWGGALGIDGRKNQGDNYTLPKESEILYYSPKPNSIVFIKAGRTHTVFPISKKAKTKQRLSINGFCT